MAPLKKKQSKHSLLPTYVLIGVGIASIVTGISWKQLTPTSSFWNAEDAATLAELQAAAHAESIPESAKSRATDSLVRQQHPTENPQSARALYESKQEELNQARRNHERWGYCLTGIGALTAFAGLLVGRSFG